MKAQESFVFFATFLGQIESVKNEAVQLAMYRAVVRYGLFGTPPDFSGIDALGLLDAAFVPIRFAIDSATARRKIKGESQRLKQQLRWGKITTQEYDSRIKSLKESDEKEYNSIADDTNVCAGIPDDTYNVNVNNKNNNTRKQVAQKSAFSFEKFWDLYSKKVDKAKCERRWATLSEKVRAKIMAHVPQYVAATPEIKYRKNPLTYLNGKCWEDDIMSPEAAALTLNDNSINKFENESLW